MKLIERIKNKKDKLIIVALIGLIAYIWFRPPASVTDSDTPLPNLPFTTLDGREGTLDGLRGKVVLVNFWATWCPYCLKEMPAIQSFYEDYRAKGVEVVALSLDDNAKDAADYMRKHGYTFAAAMASPELQAALGPVDQVPMTMVIDRNGRLRHTVHGQVYYGRMENLVTPLLKAVPATTYPKP